MVTSMAMLLLRAEAPLQPLVFVRQYLLLTPGAIVFASVDRCPFRVCPLALRKTRRCPLLLSLDGVAGSSGEPGSDKGGISWGRYLDFTGFGFMISQAQRTLGVESISIGSSPVDPSLTPIVFPGLSLTSGSFVPRLVSSLLPIVLLPIATLFFHRFDPVRTGRSADKGKRNWIGRIQMLFKPISRRLSPSHANGARYSFTNAIWADALLTLTLFPLALVAIVGAAVFARYRQTCRRPCQLFLLHLRSSSPMSRRAKCAQLRRPASTRAPRLRENFVWWKFASAFVLALLMCAVPILRARLALVRYSS